jgi:hypothetical protein
VRGEGPEHGAWAHQGAAPGRGGGGGRLSAQRPDSTGRGVVQKAGCEACPGPGCRRSQAGHWHYRGRAGQGAPAAFWLVGSLHNVDRGVVARGAQRIAGCAWHAGMYAPWRIGGWRSLVAAGSRPPRTAAWRRRAGGMMVQRRAGEGAGWSRGRRALLKMVAVCCCPAFLPSSDHR